MVLASNATLGTIATPTVYGELDIMGFTTL